MDDFFPVLLALLFGAWLGIMIATVSFKPEQVGDRQLIEIGGKWYEVTPAK